MVLGEVRVQALCEGDWVKVLAKAATVLDAAKNCVLCSRNDAPALAGNVVVVKTRRTKQNGLASEGADVALLLQEALTVGLDLGGFELGHGALQHFTP